MSSLEALLKRREKDNRAVINTVKKLILDVLKPETLKIIRKGEYSFRSVYDLGIGTTHWGFYEHSLKDYIRRQNSCFNLHDIDSAVKELEDEKKVASINLDLSSAHNPDSNYKRVYYLSATHSK